MSINFSVSISTNTASKSTNSNSISTHNANGEKTEGICINDFNTVTGEYCGVWLGATLKKLPLWGEDVTEDAIDFEWPTPEIFAEMRPDASIQSIEFTTHEFANAAGGVSSVQVTLSNGQSSPLFETSSTTHAYHETINFDKATPIRAVAAVDRGNFTARIKFLDSDSAGNELYTYDPLNNT